MPPQEHVSKTAFRLNKLILHLVNLEQPLYTHLPKIISRLTIILIKESRNAQCAIMLHSIWQAV